MTTNPTAIWDTVALLTLFDSVNKISRVDGNLKSQKLVFLAELEGQQHHLKAAHFRFFRYTYGPFSHQVANKIDALESRQVLTPGHLLTKRGRYILDYVSEFVEASHRASEATQILRDVAHKFGRKTGAQLKEYVYGLKVPVIEFGNRPRKVRDLQIGVDILDPSRHLDSVEVMPFDDETLEELRAELEMPPGTLNPNSPGYKRTISEALRRATA